MLEVELKKQLNGFCLNVSFKTEQNVLGLLGASGSGKSMTLKCIAGIITPDEGRIVLNGRVLFDSSANINLKPQLRQVGYLFQSYALFPHMSVYKNIEAGLSRMRPKARRHEAVEKIIRAFYLDGLERRLPHDLSGGQQQRVALCRMLIAKPELILLDEPFSGLDSYLKWQLEQELIEMLKRYEGEAVFVSHSMEEVKSICSKVCLLSEGKSLGITKISDLLERPATLAAARLTGKRNFSRAKRVSETELKALDWGLTFDCGRPLPEKFNYIGVDAASVRLESNAKNSFFAELLGIYEGADGISLTLKPCGCIETGEFSVIRAKLKGVKALPKVGETLSVFIEPSSLMLLN